jgi:hypothetical protein
MKIHIHILYIFSIVYIFYYYYYYYFFFLGPSTSSVGNDTPKAKDIINDFWKNTEDDEYFLNIQYDYPGN